MVPRTALGKKISEYEMVSVCVCTTCRTPAEGQLRFIFPSSLQGTGQGREGLEPYGGGAGGYGQRRRKGAPGPLGGPFCGKPMCTHTQRHTGHRIRQEAQSPDEGKF